LAAKPYHVRARDRAEKWCHAADTACDPIRTTAGPEKYLGDDWAIEAATSVHCTLEGAVTPATHHGDDVRDSSGRRVTGDLVSHDDIQRAVVVEIDSNNRRRIEARRVREVHARVERAVPAAAKQGETDGGTVDGYDQIECPITVEVASGERLSRAGDRELHPGLESAVAVSQHEGRRVDAQPRQIELAVAVEVRDEVIAPERRVIPPRKGRRLRRGGPR
jgi:hypothetical protein